jgi:hypothetical protein
MKTRGAAVVCAMTPRAIHTPPRSRGAMRPSAAGTFRPEIIEGAGKAGCPLHPQPRMQNKKAYERSHHRFTGVTRPSPRNGFNGLLRDLLGDRALLPPSPAEIPQA